MPSKGSVLPIAEERGTHEMSAQAQSGDEWCEDSRWHYQPSPYKWRASGDNVRLPQFHASPYLRHLGPLLSRHGKAADLQMRRVPVNMPGQSFTLLRTAVVGPTGPELDAAGVAPDAPVLLLLHSFDSSSLEWRRLYPLLQQRAGLPVVAVDLLGWGFTDHAAWQRHPRLPVTPALKCAHLEAFRQQHLGGRPLVLAGTSLGGTIAADFAIQHPQAVQRLVLISAQGFTEGVPPAPWPLAALGVALLRTVWLRSRANQVPGVAAAVAVRPVGKQGPGAGDGGRVKAVFLHCLQLAYYDKATWATDDAWRVGRLNTFLPGWFEANVAFIQSGGYFMPEQRIQQIQQPVLLLWGRHDEIIEPKLADRWASALGPQRCRLCWVERAGHSPQIEQAEMVAEHIIEFLACRHEGQEAGAVRHEDGAPAPIPMSKAALPIESMKEVAQCS
ncbi:hypothetical protein QJQ45_020465 [Haematococcus lacustris]|nr:hypothetical protein QJQ45_020465 [Haematococcus lacustris]